jgi:hypothetical protein
VEFTGQRLDLMQQADLPVLHLDQGIPLAAGQIVETSPDGFDLALGEAVDAVVMLGGQAVLLRLPVLTDKDDRRGERGLE